MEITDGAAWAFGLLTGAVAGATGWLYARISGVHGRIDKVANHMTAEDNKLHARIDNVQERYVRREDLDQRLSRIELGQDRVLEKLETLDQSFRHKINNIEQRQVLLDERQRQAARASGGGE